MKLDTFAGQVYVVTVNEARLQGHEYVTPEHFLYSALMFDVGKEIVHESGGNIPAIVTDLQLFFKEFLPVHVTENPTESHAFVQLFELAAAQAHSTGRKTVTLAELLSSIFFLQESHAQYILLKNGLDRVSMLKYISHGLKRDEEGAIIHVPASNHQRVSYTVDLCQKARSGGLDPLIGREEVLERTVQVLCRRLKNNPIHVGDPGVGKTAIAEGLAQRIVAGRVPKALLDAQVLQLDIGTLLAGTKYRGDFEERLVSLLDAVSGLPNPILYIDEIHTIVGAGATSGGAMDATGIIKPYLSRGEIRFIGSTTFDEYKKHFEKDRALVRRFQRIDISEPSADECISILQGLKPRYERHHKVRYSDDIIELIVSLSARYMNDRRLPDKAIDVMDESGVLANFASESKGSKGKKPSDFMEVSQAQVEHTVALMAKVPKNSVAGDEKNRLRNLEKSLNQEVFGQEKAVETIANSIKAARSGLNEPEKPVANLLFVGPTGVGKTEIAKQLANILGIELTRFDMSEYQERHAVARLIGAPPGYVGYEEGGLLTEAIRRTPHCVLLLDEIEKAHKDILNVLLQVMDYGSLTDNNGKKADFRNVIIIMTSNAGASELTKKPIGFGERHNFGAVDKAVEQAFSPEFRNRLDAIIQFNPVNEAMALSIAHKALDKLVQKMATKEVKFKVTKGAARFIAQKGLSETYGAREIIRVVENDVKKLLVNEVLFGDLAEGGVATLQLDKRGKTLVVGYK